MKWSLIIFGLLSFNFALCQFTYDSDQHYSVGTAQVYEVSNFVNPNIDFTVSGEDLAWDYSNIEKNRSDTLVFIDPNDSGYRTSFCIANFLIFNCQSEFDDLTNIAVREADTLGFGDFQTENIVRHFSKSENEYAETMLGVTAEVNGTLIPAAFEFESPDEYVKFPVNFGNVDSSKSRLVIDLNPVGVNVRLARTRNRLNEVEGYGTLRTPAGMYNEVLKMKTTIYNSDSTQLDTVLIPISTVEVEYKWFAKGYSGPVMTASGLKIGGNEVISSVRYQNEADVSSLSTLDQEEEIILSPNPFSRSFHISTKQSKLRTVEIYDSQARRVYQKSYYGPEVDLEPNLPAGVYHVRLLFGDRPPVLRKVVSL